MNEVAQIIYSQLGGGRFPVMTGARNFAAVGKGLSFRLPGAKGFTRSGINYVKITLEPSDTYTVEFGRVYGNKYTIITTLDDVYCDKLKEVISYETGLCLSL